MIRDEVSFEVQGDEFTPQERFLCTVGNNLCAAGKIFAN